MTEKLEKFFAFVDLYKDERTDKELFMSELSRFETVDCSKENLFNQYLPLMPWFGIRNFEE